MAWLEAIVGLVLGLSGGIGGMVLYTRRGLKQKRERILEDARKEGEKQKKDKVLQAKEKFLELKSEHEKTIQEREEKIRSQEEKARSREAEVKERSEALDRKERSLQETESDLQRRTQELEAQRKELVDAREQYRAELERVSGLSAEAAKEKLIEDQKEEARTEAMARAKAIKDEAELNARHEARKIVVRTIQRVATEEAVENAVTVFNLENDEIKGRIIGREGRNIRAIESCTGVELVVDDTPGAVLLSCFDPIRREIARLALHQLVSDGRIHPTRVEEVVEKVTQQLEDEIVETGKQTCVDLGVHGLHSELIRMVGRMKYRSSYGQNLLQHSREVANLSATMAAELGLDATSAKRAGLLHDIGKVPDDEPEKPHAIVGMEYAEKYGEQEPVLNAIGAHHDEIEMDNLIAPVVQVCDGISGARPGVRNEVMDTYMKRIQELEQLPHDYEGVTRSYAIQAGRELRVMVESDKVSDQEADQLSHRISSRIEDEMTYPGQVKVNVIREKRAVNVAK